MTATLVGWLPLFARPDIVQIIYGSWQFLQQNRGLKLFGYVIMENHLHWVASSPDLSKDAGDFKSFTARRIIDRFQEQRAEPILRQLAYFKQAHKSGQIYQLWQDGHHPQQIVSEEMMLQKLEYMHNNPIRRGYVDDAADWRYSSARNYAGRTGLIEVVSDWRRE
jgi:REP element-mobilizing transposase RayT